MEDDLLMGGVRRAAVPVRSASNAWQSALGAAAGVVVVVIDHDAK
jgi:hypothetical protein